jgi:succinate-semialdehyde dehydrogenase/glutarate-semialdehyde dehydrogenase
VQKNNLIKSEAYVNGKWVAAGTGKTFDVNNPATREFIASIPDMSREDVRLAIDAANNAWYSYRELTAGQRAAC